MGNHVTLTGVVTDVEYNGISTRINLKVDRSDIDICVYKMAHDISDRISVGDTITVNGFVEATCGTVLNWIFIDDYVKM